MKTAISLPDGLFEEAEAAAQRLGVSRSQLFARALESFLHSKRSDEITAKLNEIYADSDLGFDPLLDRAQRLTVEKAEW